MSAFSFLLASFIIFKLAHTKRPLLQRKWLDVQSRTVHEHKYIPNVNAGEAGVYAIVDDVSNNVGLGQYDSNGALTVVARADNAPITSVTGEALGCIDRINNIYYTLYQVPIDAFNYNYTGLYPYNLNNPSQQYDPIILDMIYPSDIIGSDESCIGDPNTGAVYVWGQTKGGTGKDIQALVKVMYNGTGFDITILGETYPANGRENDNPGALTMFDSNRNYIWTSGYDANSVGDWAYFYIDAKTGNLTNTWIIDYYEFYTLYYDPNLDLLVGIGHDDTSGLYFLQADPVSLQVTKKFDPLGSEYCAVIAIYDEDVTTGTFYQHTAKGDDCGNPPSWDGYLTQIDVTTGKVILDTLICPGLRDCPWDIKYWAGSS